MKKTNWLVGIAFLLLLSSCSPNKENSNSKPSGVLSDAQKQTLEKAKQVEDQLKEDTEKRMKAVNEAN